MRLLTTFTLCLSLFAAHSLALGQESNDNQPPGEAAADPPQGSPPTSSGAAPATPAKPPAAPHAAILKDAKEHSGIINVYQKGSKLYAELNAANYSSEYIILISIARGIGQGNLLGGMSWGFGDDWVWQFRKIDDDVHIVRKNVRFKAKKGSPESSAVQAAYTDSVLFSLPVMTKGPKGGDLIDLTPVFMGDLPQISRSLPGYAFSPQKSTWAAVKGFKDNLELQVAATYASGGGRDIETVPDARGVTINVHYSISKLPSTGYTPRLADDRVGYFLTVAKDYSKDSDRDHFVRYINRWDLQKADASAKLSPPKKPIVFWIEKTAPFKYRKAIGDGILEWNKAFEQAGFVNAIEVRQQPDDAEWDPEDINYNTFRWITSSAGFAMGPSRVNPYTGQILDADIIFDADFLTFWKEEFETFTPEKLTLLTAGSRELDGDEGAAALTDLHPKHDQCVFNRGMSVQLALGATALAAWADPAKFAEAQEDFITQGLKHVTMHEVGHTLGLRHNFKASTWRSLHEINDDKNGGLLVASVMDYSPANIMPKDMRSGRYFSETVGPYDLWAIEYGYKALSGGTDAEVAELKKIAARSGESGHAYATDEDTVSSDPDPASNRFDLGSDAIEYAKTRAALFQELTPGLVDRMVKEGDDYVQARRAFNVLFAEYGNSMGFAERYIGGLHTSVSHKGDKDGKPPIEVIDPKTQRAALEMLEQHLFNDKPFEIPPELYNHLGPSRWRHWGTSPTTRKDFPIHDFISQWQTRVLASLLSSTKLERVHDTELKVPADQDAFTTAELIERLTKAIFAEVDAIKEGEFTNRKPAISSLRRNLQRNYFSRLANLAMGQTSAPDDCQTVAWAELSSLNKRIKNLLENDKPRLDSYTRAHLQETSSRIEKVLDARLTLSSP